MEPGLRAPNRPNAFGVLAPIKLSSQAAGPWPRPRCIRACHTLVASGCRGPSFPPGALAPH
eukprot:6090366-Heterocapsa_arctica.AAC.1